MFRVTVLGTAAASPTRERGLPAVAVEREGDLLLFDCGEGTQRQMMLANPPLSNPRYIFVTHMHGDHLLGLLGLIQSMALQNREEPLHIYGPRGLGEMIRYNLEALRVYVPFKIIVHRVRRGAILSEREYTVSAERTIHTNDSYAYRLDEKKRPGKFYPEKALALGVPKGPLWKRLQGGRAVKVGGNRVTPAQVMGPKRRGRSFGYSGDTRPTKELKGFFRGVDLLVFDGTYGEEHSDKAKEYLHSTVVEAAKLASEAKVGRLLLTHLSARVSDYEELTRQAKKRFSRAEVARDFLSVVLPLPE